MTNPTSNYGFVLPTATDLVTDLPADFDVALQGVDTRLKALQPGTTLGDLVYSSATANTNTRLGIGSNGQVLAVVAGVPAWAATADQTPLTTKGDLFTFTTVDARLGVGANNTVLTADSAEATGLKWATPSGSAKTYTLVNSGGTSLSGTSVSITGLSSYDDLLIIVRGASCTAASQTMYMSVNSVTSSNSYTRAGLVTSFSSTYSNGISDTQDASDTEIRFGTMSNNAASTVSGGVSISGCRGTGVKPLDVVAASTAGGGSGNNGFTMYKGVINATTAISSVEIFSGTFDAGTIFVYGAV